MRNTLLALAAIAATFALGNADARTFQEQVSADPHGEVDVSNVAGTIEINGWDKPQVAVTAEVASDTQQVKVTTDHGRTSVRVTSGPGGWFAGEGAVRLEVRVPRQSELNVSGVSASITSRGIDGAQHLQTVSGEIDAELGSGNDEVKSVSGDVRLRGSGRSGALRVTSVSGKVSVTNAAGELEATTVSGPLDAQLASARSVRLHTTSGRIELTARLARGGTIEAESVSGEEKIDASAESGYAYELRTFSGDIENCFGQQSERTSEYGPGWRLDGSRGAGDGRVRLKSLSGPLSLCDH